MYTIPPQVLHGILLATNKLIEDCDSVCKQMKQSSDCDESVHSFSIFDEIIRLHIVREGYQGKTFEGKQCRTILKSLDKINFPVVLQPFVVALKCHKALVDLAYKEILPDNYSEVISNLKTAFNVLITKYSVTVSNKFHIIFDHLEQYYDHTKLSLVKTSDELIESMHQYVHKRMLRGGYKVKDVCNPLHGRNLYRAVLHINAYNIVFDNSDHEIDVKI